jgi:hypothetical protein
MRLDTLTAEICMGFKLSGVFWYRDPAFPEEY